MNKSHSFKYYKEQYTLLNNQNLEKQRIIDELRNKNKNLEFEIRELTNDNNSKNEKIQEINAQNENMTQILSEIININESICLIEKKISLNKMHNEKCYDNLMMYNNNDENRKLAQLRDTLLPKLMNGEIDLDNIKI